MSIGSRNLGLSMFKRILLAGATFVFTAAGALAADVEPTSYDWTGPYIGLQAGYGWGKDDLDVDYAPGNELGTFDVNDLKADGFIGGAHAGYLIQSGSLVYGVEGDIEFADMKGKEAFTNVNGFSLGDYEKTIDWLGSLRLRAGVTVDRVLFYTTGGLAVGGTDTDFDFSQDFPYGLDADDGTKWGWTIGGGIDYAISTSLSARIEYRYTDLADTSLETRSFSVNPQDYAKAHFDNDFHAVRAGLSWHF
jgi:outer membrane immunogenic protein